MYFAKELNKFSNIKHCFFSKNGGVSKNIYNSLNCGLGSKDENENVLNNLSIVANKMRIDKSNLYLMNQTHSNKVIVINKRNQEFKRVNSDAIITSIKNIAISVLTADCVPILIYDKINQIVACVHAGWKGAVNGIIENTFNQMIQMNKNNNFYVAIGPCIGLENYEVGKEFYEEFIRENKINEKFFSSNKNNKFNFDLRKYVNFKITKFEVKYVENLDLDTYAEKENFFSFRRSRKLGEKDYGRCISTIGLISN
ncbi:MAG: peptidoglycan editing factor PgeF [Pelagibacteraceae bacterium]|jgi:polyphenol oxidase|nr:peptidoglycan editing factor PgeF [Pelagibacteraceae bacterium]